MSRFAIRAAVTVALITTTAACTQRPVAIDLKGQNNYGRNGTQYASTPAPSITFFPAQQAIAAPVNPVTVQVADAPQSVAISELTPPAQQQPASAVIKETPVATVPTPVAPAQVATKPNINPWTGKPREMMTAEAPTKPRPVKLSVDETSPSFIWPVNGNKVLSGFGPKGGGKVNDGINVAAADGEPVWAAADGEVVYASDEMAGYGNMVMIKHAGNKTTTYAHLNRTTVDKYERVKQGDIIGYVGSTGSVKKSQLYFAVRDGKEFVDPQRYVSRSLASN